MENTQMEPKTLIVATVQMASALNDREVNLAKARGHVEQAVRQGAELVLLPELMPGGYVLEEAIWESGEPFDGPTTRWMRDLSQRLDIYLGTTFLEAEGEHFYNTFAMTDPGGEVVARVRKNPPASFEAYLFTAGSDPHWFDTPIGRIGVSICFENGLYDRYLELHSAGIDLWLRPFSAAPFGMKNPLPERDVEIMKNALRLGTGSTAKALGIPVVMSNKIGRFVTTLPGGFPAQDSEFPGFSAIADSDGELLAQMGPGVEGVVVGTVVLDPKRKNDQIRPRIYGRWTTKMPWWSFMWTLTQWMGERSYRGNARRKAMAQAKSHPLGARRKDVHPLARSARTVAAQAGKEAESA
jgi:N-carbamoylputrescine amidase